VTANRKYALLTLAMWLAVTALVALASRAEQPPGEDALYAADDHHSGCRLCEGDRE